eukprot:6981655-Prymnesium_polylepis.1
MGTAAGVSPRPHQQHAHDSGTAHSEIAICMVLKRVSTCTYMHGHGACTCTWNMPSSPCPKSMQITPAALHVGASRIDATLRDGPIPDRREMHIKPSSRDLYELCGVRPFLLSWRATFPIEL